MSLGVPQALSVASAGSYDMAGGGHGLGGGLGGAGGGAFSNAPSDKIDHFIERQEKIAATLKKFKKHFKVIQE